MIQERTKFYSGLDKKKYMGDVFHEFLDIYSKTSKMQPVNKMNMDVLYSINDYIEKFTYFRRLTTVILEFLKDLIQDGTYVHNFIKLKESCLKQYNLVLITKKTIKKVPLDKKYYVAIKYEINGISNRLDYLLENVVFEYLRMTPLNDYMKYLERNGKTLQNDINENIDLDNSVLDNPNISNYVKTILDSLGISDEEYLEKRKTYETFLQRKYELIEKDKEEQKQKQKEKRFLETEAKLQVDASNLEKLINSRKLHSINILARQFSNLKFQNEKLGRIILIGKTLKGANARTHYLSKDGTLVDSVSKIKVFTFNEKYPDEIQKKIDSKDYASAEILIPL